MRSYALHIDGEARPGRGWTYVADASALIREPRRAFAAKRGLELGREVAAEDRALVAGRCAWGDEQDNQDALVAAAAAARELRRLPVSWRRAVGAGIGAALRAGQQELVEVLVAEGHPRRLAVWEVAGLLEATDPEVLDWTFGQVEQRFTRPGRELLVTRKPDGVVCINPPQNAAAANSALGIGALMAGNALVVKAPKTAPLGVMHVFQEIVLPVLEEHGAPPGTVNLVSGYSKRILQDWLQSPLVDDIMFFGDSTAGLALGQACVQRGKKPVLELAGNDAVVVWRDADVPGAARALAECFYGSGQICMVPKQAVVHPAVADALLAELLAVVGRLRPGYPSDDDVVLSPVLKADRFHDVLAEAEGAGAQRLCGGRRIDVDGRPSAAGAFLEPTVLRVDGLEGARELRAVAEETFFPLLPVVVAEDGGDDLALLDRVVEWVETNPYGLRNSLWSSDPEVVEAFTHRVTNGGLLKVNESHIGWAPFLASHGGTGLTGGPFGEGHYPMFRTSHLQGVAVSAPAPVAALAPLAVGA